MFDRFFIICSRLVLLFVVAVLAQARHWPGAASASETTSSGAPLLEENYFGKRAALHAKSLRVASFNLHHPDRARLERIIAYFKQPATPPDVILVQEIDRKRNKNDRIDAARIIAEELHMNSAYAAHNRLSAADGGGDHGVAILSRWPLLDARRIVLPPDTIGIRVRAAVAATLDLDGEPVRIYTAHLQRELSGEERRSQMHAIVDDAARSGVRSIVIAGDFNTTSSGVKREVFGPLYGAGYTTPFLETGYTFKRAIFLTMHLDWMFVRNLQATNARVDHSFVASDHRPIWMEISNERGAAGSGQWAVGGGQMEEESEDVSCRLSFLAYLLEVSPR